MPKRESSHAIQTLRGVRRVPLVACLVPLSYHVSATSSPEDSLANGAARGDWCLLT
jgi:hypothetical protein